MTTQKKARRYKRVELPKGMLVAWEHAGIRKLSRVSVLALGGLFISTPEPPPNGDTIRLIFEIPGGEVRALAIVRDCQPRKGMGIEFKAMGQQDRIRLHQFMQAITRV
jgi:PilZ domain